MYLTMMIFMALASTAIEIKAVRSSKALERWLSKGFHFGPIHIQAGMMDLITSLGISYLLGALFSATGVVVVGAAMISTGLTLPYYPNMARIDASIARTKESWNDNRDQIIQTFKDFAHLIYWIMRVLTLPVRAIRWVSIHLPEPQTRSTS
jgi:hypothetical protein